MIFLLVLLDACNYRSSPFNDQVFEAVPLVQVSIHELFHGLSREPVFFAFLVELSFLRVDVIDQIPQLSQRQSA